MSVEVRDEYVADVTRYSGPLREAARDADRFADRNDRAALAARRMGLAAKGAADKAARAQKDAADAADKLARGEVSVDEAARAAARAENEVERASIRAAEAQRAAAAAADRQAAQLRQVARDAQLAATAQLLGALKAKGSVDQYNEVLRQAKVLHGDLSKTALSSFKTIEKEGNAAAQALDEATSSLGEMNKLITVGVANGLIMLPELASVAADGITLGLGGAIAAVGIKFAAQNKQVRAEFSSLGHFMSTELTRDAQPFVRTLEDIGKQARASFVGWEPEIRSLWADMAPAVDRFATSAIRSLDELKPALESITRGFDAQLNALGPQMGPIMHNIATGIGAIGDAAARNPQALASLVTDLSLIVRYAGDGIGALVRYKSEFDAFMQVFAGGGPMGLLHFIDGINQIGQDLGAVGRQIQGTSHDLQIGGGSFATFAQQAAGSTAATMQFKTAQDLAALSADKLTNALNKLAAANMNEDAAAIAQAQAANAAAKANDHRRGVSLNERSALLSLAEADQTLIEKMAANGESADVVAGKMGSLRAGFIATAEKMNYTAAQAKALADRYGLLPSRKYTKIDSNAAAATEAVRRFQQQVNALRGKTITINEIIHATTYSNQQLIGRTSGPGRNARGGLIHRAAGGLADGGPSGYVRGPGTTTSDSILVALSDKEYVVNAKQTAKYLPLLEAINKGVDGFKRGGSTAVVGGSTFDSTPTYGWKTPAALIRADKRVARAKARPEYAAAMAAQASLARMRANVYGGFFRGGPSTIGSAHGSVVQHVTNVTVNVAGSIRSDRQITEIIRQQLAQRSVYNSGNNGTTVPRGV